jgi:hypothetical protein
LYRQDASQSDNQEMTLVIDESKQEFEIESKPEIVVKPVTLCKTKKFDTDYEWQNEEYQKHDESDDPGLPESASDDSSDDE